MIRHFSAAAAIILVLVCVGQAATDDEVVLDKKASLKADDPGYKPTAGVDKLTAEDTQVVFQAINNNPHQIFTLKLKKGDKMLFEVKSTEIDPVVIVEDSKKTVLAFNDDDPAGGTTDSRLEWTAPADDEYRIIVVAFGDDQRTGAYHLKATKNK
jgi:hypothetical protein